VATWATYDRWCCFLVLRQHSGRICLLFKRQVRVTYTAAMDPSSMGKRNTHAKLKHDGHVTNALRCSYNEDSGKGNPNAGLSPNLSKKCTLARHLLHLHWKRTFGSEVRTRDEMYHRLLPPFLAGDSTARHAPSLVFLACLMMRCDVVWCDVIWFDLCLSHLRYFFDTDQVMKTRYGERRSMLSLTNPGQTNGLVITSTMPTSDHEVHLVEVRELIDGGMAHTQVSHTTYAAPFCRGGWLWCFVYFVASWVYVRPL